MATRLAPGTAAYWEMKFHNAIERVDDLNYRIPTQEEMEALDTAKTVMEGLNFQGAAHKIEKLLERQNFQRPGYEPQTLDEMRGRA